MENFQLTIDWANRDWFSIVLGFISGILVFLIGRWLARVLTRYTTRYMERAKLDPMVIRFMATFVFVGTMMAVIIAALSQAGIHTTSLTALLASAGLAIGLALKDSLSNLASGVMILLYKPYKMNDLIDAAGSNGSVEEVQIFNTILRTPDNVKVIVPNTAILRGNIKNFSAYESRRVDLAVDVDYQVNIGEMRDTLMEMMKSHPLVLPEPPPSVDVLGLAEKGVQLAVRSWVPTDRYAVVRSELLEQMKALLEKQGKESQDDE